MELEKFATHTNFHLAATSAANKVYILYMCFFLHRDSTERRTVMTIWSLLYFDIEEGGNYVLNESANSASAETHIPWDLS